MAENKVENKKETNTEKKNPIKEMVKFFAGVRKEAKKVTWLKKEDLLKDTLTVLAFTFAMGVFFYLSDALIALIMRALGLN